MKEAERYVLIRVVGIDADKAKERIKEESQYKVKDIFHLFDRFPDAEIVEGVLRVYLECQYDLERFVRHFSDKDFVEYAYIPEKKELC